MAVTLHHEPKKLSGFNGIFVRKRTLYFMLLVVMFC